MKLELHQAAKLLRESRYLHMGIAPSPLHPPKSPAASTLAGPDIAAFAHALDSARSTWPGAGTFALIGADSYNHEQTPKALAKGAVMRLPPGIHELLDPQVLLEFDA